MDLVRRARDRIRAGDGRLVGIDVARCLALIGMMATHILPGYVEGEVTWTQQLAGGRASALFAVLAGVSMALMTGRRQPVNGARRKLASAGLVVRALFIAMIGLLIGALPSGLAVILTYYGLLFLMGLPFVGLRARSLAVLSVVWLLVAPVVSQLVRPHLPEPSLASPSLTALADPWQLLTELTFTGYYPTVPWLAYLLAGMALGRLDLRRLRAAGVLVVGGVGIALTAWGVSRSLTSRPDAASALRATYDPEFTPTQADLESVLAHGLYGTTPTESWWWLTVVAPHTATPFDLAQTIGSALAVIGLCLLVTRWAPRVFAVVLGAGAMTLTLYTAHVLMRTPQVWPSPEHGMTVYQTHLLAVLGSGAVFGLLGLRGPLEAVTARLAQTASVVVALVYGAPATAGRDDTAESEPSALNR
ncbi:MAG TPA: heparan-alpha-glucosaminide N-acetyltransferase domain-containing protein [Nocardioidaceae bacterium]|nr:heparan-alpha-glucosaminide N-acetyltransferase domain-containing protein [Nocardioidaceae bacterium]